MDTCAWLDLWNDHILRDYFSALALACSHDECVVQDLIATAWIAVGGCESDVAPEWALHVGGMALMGRFKDCHRPPRRAWYRDPAYQRTYRVTKKYFCVVKSTPLLMCDNRV